MWDVDPEQPLTNVRTLDDILLAGSADRRFQALLFSMFALLALVTLGGSRGGTAKQPPTQTFSLDVPSGEVEQVLRSGHAGSHDCPPVDSH